MSNIIVTISLRNLIRQKRRNMLLGIAIAFGVMILVMAHSFSKGISDIMFNRIAKWAAGHVSINFAEKGNMMRQVFRDKARIMAAVDSAKDGNEVLEIDEGLGIFGRVIGNKKTDNMVLVSIEISKGISKETLKEVEEQYRMIEGDWMDLIDTSVENPVILSKEKADYLQVKKGDILRIRFKTMFGQDQAARATVAGIFKNTSIFMNMVTFMDLNNIKRLMNVEPYETGDILVTVRNPQKNAIPLAEKIYSSLSPDIAVFCGDARYGDRTERAVVYGYRTGDEFKKTVEQNIKLLKGNSKDTFSRDGVLISGYFAGKLGAGTGSTVRVKYRNKFKDIDTEINLKITGIFESAEFKDKNIILVNEDKFYDAYYYNLPKSIREYNWVTVPDKKSKIYSVLSPEWELLPRSKTTEDLQKKMKQIGKRKWKGTVVDVRTMYESASDILKLEAVLNLITFSAVMVLFFIILIGVVNTLRMSIRERTREIGTVRAIGMQKTDVRNSFILETFFLALFSSIAGTAMGFIIMFLLSRIKFTSGDNPFFDMLLVDCHLHFMPTFMGIFLNVMLILVIAVVTAYFPARRAAQLTPSKALRHYE